MERRSFLRAGVGLGGAGVALANEGCGHGTAAGQPQGDAPDGLPDPAVAEEIARSLDRRMAAIADEASIPAVLQIEGRAPRTPAERARAEQHGRLLRQSLRSLYLGGRFRDLPDEIKTHPAIQARLWDAQPEMDEAVFGVTELLESLGPEDHRRIQTTLQSERDLGERLAFLLDETGKQDGIPFSRRMSVRSSTLQLARQMAAQPPALTIDPYVRRVRRIEARPRTEHASARIQAARVGEKAFWEHQHRLADLQTAWQRRLAQSGPAASNPPAAPPPAPAPPGPSTGRRIVGTGGTIMGFGAGSVGVGLICAGIAQLGADIFLTPALIFGVTVGPILLIVGLIVLLVGAIWMASE